MVERTSLSNKFKSFLTSLSQSCEFKRAQYYMRCLKKAPHGGIFRNNHQCMFLRYYPVCIYTFLKKNAPMPYPLEPCKKIIEQLISTFDICIEELLEFCFVVDIKNTDNKMGDRLYIAMTSGVLALKETQTDSFEEVASKAISGEIRFLDHFNYDFHRLIDIFLLLCIEANLVPFYKIEDIHDVEELDGNCDKYGLSEITCANFERQGFTVNNHFILYSIFLDTSISNTNAKEPKTIEIIKKYLDSSITIFMRKDKVLTVPLNKKVVSASLDMQKWRGVTLDFDKMDFQIKTNKEVIVHFCPKTKHKVVVVIRKSVAQNNEIYYHISVEELWSPDSICEAETVVLTNFIHSCYYPNTKSFDHLDFSVNQYDKEIFLKKYQDAFGTTAVSIEQYANIHYKVWCVKGKQIPLKMWAELTTCTLDEPFRKIFAEIINAKIINID